MTQFTQIGYSPRDLDWHTSTWKQLEKLDKVLDGLVKEQQFGDF